MVTIIFIVILFLGSGIFYFRPYYRIVNRTEKMEEFKGTKNEKPLGWLRVQGTNIDFPIFYYDDIDVTSPKYELGWSYIEDRKLTKKITIFSHNILNVSSTPLVNDKNHKRFEQLMSFIYTDYVKKNKYIQYTIGNKDYLYKIYGVSFQKESNLEYMNNSPSKNEIKMYINRTKNNSYFKFDLDVNESDNLITLITCTRFFGETTEYSFVVDARMIRKNERINNYKVHENKNYKDIKKRLKGDVNDEKI